MSGLHDPATRLSVNVNIDCAEHLSTMREQGVTATEVVRQAIALHKFVHDGGKLTAPADLPVATGDAGTEVPLRLVEHLAHTLSAGHRCELVADQGGRCKERAVGVRWEDGFADVVCTDHADTARRRGAFVVLAKRHDGTDVTSAAGSSPEDAGELVGLSEAERQALSDSLYGAGRRPAAAVGGPVFEAVERILAGRLAAVEQEAAALREQVAAVAALLAEAEKLTSERPNYDFDGNRFQVPISQAGLRTALPDPASVLAQRDAEVGAKALAVHRLEWADYISNWSAAVGASPPTVESIIEALRQPSPPFGRARGPRQGVERG